MTTPPATPQSQAILKARNALSQNPVYLDTETTGLDKNSEIVEISIIDDSGATLFESFVRPSKPIPASATAIHHITDAMVKNASPWPSVWQQVRSVLFGRLVAIYNAEYDLRLMQASYEQYRLPWKEKINSICIMKLYAEFRGQYDPIRRAYKYHSLDLAGKQCNISLPNSHRATDDSLLTRALLHYMAEKQQA
jgi:DNA polymerase-3 subunit epsilon